MLRKCSMMLSIFLVVIVSLLLLGGGSARAADPDKDNDSNKLRLFTTMPVPDADLQTFDISWVDPSRHLYYLADRSNAGVDVYDTGTNTFVGRVSGFVGFTGNNDTSGPDGVVAFGDRAYAGDGDSTLKVIDVDSLTVIQTISTGGKNRVDEMALDHRGKRLLTVNDADDPPFLTLWSTEGGSAQIVLNNILIPGATVDGGIEQPVFEPKTQRFLVAVPQLNDGPDGGVAVIDPTNLNAPFEKIFLTPGCKGHGLALGPRQQLLVACNNRQKSIIISAETGDLVATITQVAGSDEAWFNRSDQRYYLAASNFSATQQVLGVIDAETNEWIENVPTKATCPVLLLCTVAEKPARSAHSVAADSVTNHIFVPIPASKGDEASLGADCKAHGCIAVFHHEE